MASSTTNAPFVVNSEAEFEEIIASGLVVVDFYADWCPPCKMLAPELERVAADVPDGVRVAKVNVDQLGSLAGRFSISSIPTIIYFKDGVAQHRSAGFAPADAIRSEIDRLNT